MQVARQIPNINALEHLSLRRRMQVLHMRERHDARLNRHIHVVARTREHVANELHHVIVLSSVLRIVHQALGQSCALSLVRACRTRARQTHAFNRLALLANEQLRRATAEEHVGVTVQDHRSARITVDEVDQQILRGEGMLGHQLLATRENNLAHTALFNGGKRLAHGLVPLLARILLKHVRDGFALALGRHLACAHEALNATGVHRAERVHLQHRALLALDEHDLGKHETQAREGAEKLVGRRRVFRIEAIEGEEHGRLRNAVLTVKSTLVVDALERRHRNAAAKAHIAHGTSLVVVNELVGKTLLQRAERVDDISVEALGERENFRHDASFETTTLLSEFYHSAYT